MNCSRALMLVALSLVMPLLGWQDDVHVNLRNPYSQFAEKPGVGFFQGADAEVRLGHYLSGSKSHTWRGGAEGDVALINFGEQFFWHMGLNMETLADDQNEINFRLVRVFYQALTGVKMKLGPGVFHVGYRHRCNHGTDTATESRITIRSGLTSSYHWVLPLGALRLDILPGINVYLLGQNRDVNSQPKGGLFVSASTVWPIRAPLFMTIAAGANYELVSAGSRNLYFISDSVASWRIEQLYAVKVALRVAQELVTTDFGLHFAQNLDTGIGDSAAKTTAFSFDIDFKW